MDHFYEQVVRKNNKTVFEVLYYMTNIFIVLFGAVGVFLLQTLLFSFSIPTLILIALFIGATILLYLNKGKFRTEYEYTFTNGELDYAKVYNNVKRKTLGSMKVKNVEAFGKVKSNYFHKLINTPGIKPINWFLNREYELYYFYYIKENKKNILIFEPDDEMVELIKKYLPFGIYNE